MCEWLNYARRHGRAAQVPRAAARGADARQPRDGPGRAARHHASSAACRRNSKIDPTRVGMLGFSAGGHLTACTVPDQEADVRRESTRPTRCSRTSRTSRPRLPRRTSIDKGGKLKPEFEVKKDSPPMFFAHSIRRPADEREQRRAVPGAEEEQRAGGIAPLRDRRPRLRNAEDLRTRARPGPTAPPTG